MSLCVVIARELASMVEALLDACGPDEDTVAATSLLGTSNGPNAVIDRGLLWRLSESAAAVLGPGPAAREHRQPIVPLGLPLQP